MENSMSATPLYYRILTDLKNQITGGALQPGEKIPTEQMLCENYAASRVTVRKALDELCEAGFIKRVPYTGHFVSQTPDTGERITRSRSMRASMEEANIPSKNKILSLKRLRCGQELSARLHCGPEEPLVAIRRLRLAGDQPLADETLYFPERMFPDINPWLLVEKPLWDVIQKDFGYPISHSVQTLEAVVPTREQMEALELKTKKPQLHVMSSIVLADQTIAEFTDCLYLSKVFPYQFTWWG